jgi:hypothetical protein
LHKYVTMTGSYFDADLDDFTACPRRLDRAYVSTIALF